jgi:LysR family transcriptional regulator, glycine cleavage system transcriptional activator
MKRHLPPLNSLRAFEAAARLGSFKAAAAELFVTHGAISRHIQQLEAWLGAPLFERHNRRVTLTDSGSRYVAEVSAVFDRLALATAQQLEQGRHRVLRVNVPATFTLRWLLPRLSTFQLSHPGIEVRLTTSNEPLGSLTQGFDLVIRGGPQAADGYLAREFLSEARLPVCSPALLKQHPLQTPADLRHHTLLHAATYPAMWSEWLTAAGVPELQAGHSQAGHALTLEHFYLTLQAALDGLGVAMGPMALVADEVAEGRLIMPFSSPALPSWRYFVYMPKERAADPAVTAFCAWLEAAGRGTV